MKPLPTRTYVEELMVRHISFAAESPGSMSAKTEAPRIVTADLNNVRNNTRILLLQTNTGEVDYKMLATRL